MTETTLAALLAGGPIKPEPRSCKFARTLAGLDDTTRLAVLDALHGEQWSDSALAKTLERAGHGHHAQGALSTHRTGACICTEQESEAA